MKKGFTTFFLFLIMIILIFGIVVLIGAIYTDLFSDTTDPVVYRIEDIATEEPVDKKALNIVETNINLSNNIGVSNNNYESKNINEQLTTNNDVSNNYFHKQLNNNQKIIYDGLNKNKLNLKQGNYVIKFGDIFANLLSKEEGGKQLGIDYQTAIEAFTHDNPDLFYIDVNKMYLNIETTTKFLKTTYNVYISPATGSTYLLDDFKSEDIINDGIKNIESTKNAILNRLTGNDYQNILYIHDYLINSIEYDSTYNSIGSYGIYGALVEKKCVCEGYAKAFKYLTNSAGLNCEIMQGTATNSSGQTETHAWNCIELNGIWYEVDPTWDDPIIIGGNGKATNKIKYKYFLKGTKTFENDHILSYQFSNEGKKFSYPTISEKDY